MYMWSHVASYRRNGWQASALQKLRQYVYDPTVKTVNLNGKQGSIRVTQDGHGNGRLVVDK